jgi:predicted  nucleic acid-binding Zn-ribbon protein
MSEERLARIESRLDDLSRDMNDVKTGQAALKGDVDDLKTGQAALKRDVDDLKAGQEEVKRDIGDLKTGQADLRRYMGALHEEVLDRIQALTFDPAPLRREFRAADAVLREELVTRIEPIEAAVRRKPRRSRPEP